MNYRLRGIPGSPFTRKAQVFLEEKGLSHEDVFTNIFPVPPELREINPMRRVPVLDIVEEHAHRHISDSSAICQYLERVHPEPALYPSDPYDFGRALMFEEFADTDLASAIGFGVFRPLVLGPMLGKAVDHERVARTLEVKLPRIYDELARELAGREYFVGDRFGVVDIAVATHFVNLRHAGHDLDGARWPHLRDLVDRVLARSSFARRIDAERELLPSPAA